MDEIQGPSDNAAQYDLNFGDLNLDPNGLNLLDSDLQDSGVKKASRA